MGGRAASNSLKDSVLDFRVIVAKKSHNAGKTSSARPCWSLLRRSRLMAESRPPPCVAAIGFVLQIVAGLA